MKAAIYNPYLDTLGGGERYTLSFAKVLREEGYDIDIEWHDPGILVKLEKRFGMAFNDIKVVDSINRGDGYDLCFWVSDGSIPALKSRKNILHFQVPFQDVNGKSLINKMKLFRINKIICNSNFTKNIIDQEFGLNSLVVYPPVSVGDIKPKRKKNIILYVGRFSELKQNKRQDILIKSFKKIIDSGISDWKLVLAGGVEVGVGNYINELKKMSTGYPIEIMQSPEFKVLKSLYGESKIFWSAAGFEVDENQSPGNVEHFGMTVVESMAAGDVPIIHNKGGFKEIVKNGENGFLWNTEKELLEITKKLILDKKLLKMISVRSIKDATRFSYEEFRSNIKQIL